MIFKNRFIDIKTHNKKLKLNISFLKVIFININEN